MNGHKAFVYVNEVDKALQQRLAEMVTAVLTTYKAYALVQVTAAQLNALHKAGFRVDVLSDTTRVTVGAFTFDTEAPPQTPEADVSLLAETGEDYFLVQFIGPLQEAWITAVTELGCELGNYIPNYTYLTYMPVNVQAQVAALPFVGWIGRYLPAFKIGPDMTTTGKRSLAQQDMVAVEIDPAAFPFDPEGNVEISLHRSDDMDTVVALIDTLGGHVIDAGGRSLVVALEPEQVLVIAGHVAVRRLGRHVPAQADNDVAVHLTNVHAVHIATLVGASRQLLGQNQIVAVYDTGLDKGSDGATTNPHPDMHPDFSGRVISLHSWGRPTGARGGAGATNDLGGHGTHVAGSIVGTGSASGGRVRGMAPEARLVFQSCEPGTSSTCSPHGFFTPADLTPVFQQAYDAGARIHNNSWGARRDGRYTDKSEQVDTFVWEKRNMTILFSAGNNGDDLNRDGRIDQDSMGAPGTAKNCITVGSSESLRLTGGSRLPWSASRYNPPCTRSAPDLSTIASPCISTGSSRNNLRFPCPPIRDDLRSNNPHGLAASSGRGPTDDGRIKPEVVAPGTNIKSCRSRDAGSSTDPYTFKTGTSMACPITAGAAILVRQFLIEVHSHQPSAALIKAMLINGATPLRGQYRPREIGAVPNSNIGWGLINLRETLHPTPPRTLWFRDEWSNVAPRPGFNVGDPPDTFTIWVTDRTETLKVTLVYTDAPGDNLVNNLNLTIFPPTGPAKTGNNATLPGDMKNNVEGVIIETPELGEHVIEVKAMNIDATHAPQDYALVISGAFARVAPPSPPLPPVIV